MKNREIDDLKVALAAKTIQPPTPDLNALVTVLDVPDLNLKRAPEENVSDEEEFDYKDQEDRSSADFPSDQLAQNRLYVKNQSFMSPIRLCFML